MKCLSVCQPFADLIIYGKKSIELRNWNTKFRGELLVHAPSKVRMQDCDRLGIPTDHTTGAIVGAVELYDTKKYYSLREVELDRRYHLASPDYPAKYGFLLRNARPLRVPVPYKGRLGFFEVETAPGTSRDEIITEMINEEYSHQWIGHH